MSNTVGFMTNDEAGKEKAREKLLQTIADAGSSQRVAGEAGHLYARYLGLRQFKKGGHLHLIQVVKEGLPLSAGDTLAKHMGLSPKVLFTHYVGMSESTLRRRRADKQPLSMGESERLVRYAHLMSLAVKLMDNDEEAARLWLSSSLPALGGDSPLEVATTETGARRVEDLIVSLEYGMFN